MNTFEATLSDPLRLSKALRQLAPSENQTRALVELYSAGNRGVPIGRDSRNRLKGPTIYQLSRVGTALTRALGGGPRDGVMWFGVTKGRSEAEFWVMRPQVRVALEQLSWVSGGSTSLAWLEDFLEAVRQVLSREVPLKSAAESVSQKHSINVNSVKQMMWAYRQMLRGATFKRTLSSDVLREFLTSIHDGGGWISLRTALDSLSQHMSYWEKHYGRPKLEFARIYEEFSAIADARSEMPSTLQDVDYEAEEGNQYFVVHLRRERDPRIRDKKRRASRLKDGSLECEACGSNSKKIFPTLEAPVWEVHHRAALSETGVETITRVTDLAILCPTCHRAIHRVRPMPSVEKFRALFFSRGV